MKKPYVIDGRALAKKFLTELKEKIKLKTSKRPPGLATILVGDDPASRIYVNNKTKLAKDLGFLNFQEFFNSDISEEILLGKINEFNKDKRVDGILVQMPLPKHINKSLVIESIDPKKDVDGFHPLNLGYLFSENAKTIPCTPKACLYMLKESQISLSSKHIVVIGRSLIVGKPLAELLLNENATVTVCHKKTLDLAHFTRLADIVISAAGKAKLLNRTHIKEGVVIIDVGINRINNKIVGDVDFDDVLDKVSAISKVPGGVGPMTVAMLMSNLWENYLRLIKEC